MLRREKASHNPINNNPTVGYYRPNYKSIDNKRDLGK